ncbi:MAG: nuclear transport factor 2 family protein [Candidatus Nomurabacteria bacterium]|nr:nuclear transport factor 2 family protein [Candidatus Nomurabacteria bacterium]
MNNTKELVEDLVKMINEGKIMDAFEKHYADNVVMQENETAPRVGKDVNREYEKAFVEGIVEFHGGKTLGIAVGDNYSTVESFMDVTHKDWGRVARTQVAVQKWENGKIVNEKFYYDTK